MGAANAGPRASCSAIRTMHLRRTSISSSLVAGWSACSIVVWVVFKSRDRVACILHHCGNPTPLTRGQPLQHRPRGRLVEGRYLPLHPAALEGTSTGPRESRTLGAPGGPGQRSFKGWARGRRGRGLTRKRRAVEPTCFNEAFSPPGVSRRRRVLFPRRPRGRAGPGGPVPLFPITEEP